MYSGGGITGGGGAAICGDEGEVAFGSKGFATARSFVAGLTVPTGATPTVTPNATGFMNTGAAGGGGVRFAFDDMYAGASGFMRENIEGVD